MIDSHANLVADEDVIAEMEVAQFAALLSSAPPPPALRSIETLSPPPMPAIGEPLLLGLALAFASLRRERVGAAGREAIIKPGDRDAFATAFLAVVAHCGRAENTAPRCDLQAAALTLFGTLTEAWQAHVGSILDALAGRTAAAEHKSAKAQLHKLLDRHAAVDAFGVLQAAAMWGSGMVAAGMIEAPRRAPPLDVAPHLAAFVWRNRASIAFPPVPTQPAYLDPDSLAIFVMAAAAWSTEALDRVAAKLIDPPLAATHRLRVVAVAAEMAAAQGASDGISKNIDIDAAAQTPFGRYVAALIVALDAAMTAYVAGIPAPEERKVFLRTSQAMPLRATAKQMSDARKKLSVILK